MAIATQVPTQMAQMIINLTDATVANDVRRLLKRVKGVESIHVTKKSEVQLSLDEAHSGQVTTWNSVGDYFKQFE